MKAILWDGHKQIKGQLILEKKRIKFKLADFSDTDLDFDLAYEEIKRVCYHKLYDLAQCGLMIFSKNDKTNIFIVEEPRVLIETIKMRCELIA